MPPRDFKPAMMEQRNGRILRQGNLHYDLQVEAFVSEAEKIIGQKFRKDKGGKSVPDLKAARKALGDNTAEMAKADAAAAKYHIHIIEYGMEKSLDSAIYQMMAAKQQFINQILMGKGEDSFEDPTDEISMSMAEMSARTIGDPLLIRMVELDRDIRRLRLDYDGWMDEVMNARNNLRIDQIKIDRGSERINRAKKAVELVKGYNADESRHTVWTINGKTIDRNRPENAPKGWTAPKLLDPLDALLLEETGKLASSGKNTREVKGLSADGLELVIELHHQLEADKTGGDVVVFASGERIGKRGFVGARGLIAAIGNEVEYARNYVNSVESEISQAKEMLPKWQAKAREPFEKQEELDSLLDEQARVLAALQGQASAVSKKRETFKYEYFKGASMIHLDRYRKTEGRASALRRLEDKLMAKLDRLNEVNQERLSNDAVKAHNKRITQTEETLEAVRNEISNIENAKLEAAREGKFTGLRAAELPSDKPLRADSPEWKAMSKAERMEHLKNRSGLRASELPNPTSKKGLEYSAREADRVLDERAPNLSPKLAGQVATFRESARGVSAAGQGSDQGGAGAVSSDVEWAKSQGRLIDASDFKALGDSHSNVTSEHEVWQSGKSGRAVKRTWAGVYGSGMSLCFLCNGVQNPGHECW